MCVVFFKQKTAYEIRISDWSSDVCSSDLLLRPCPLGCVALRVEPVEHTPEVRGVALDGRAAERDLELIDRQSAQALGNHRLGVRTLEIGRASCRERVCQYV